MSATKQTIIGVLVGAVGLAVLLYIAPKTPSDNHEGHNHAEESTNVAVLDAFVVAAEKNISESDRVLLANFKKAKQNDSILNFWSQSKRPDLAAYFAEQKAMQSQTAANWLNAGERYYGAARFVKDNTELPILYQCAIRCLKTAIEKGSQESKTKILLASCYVEGTEKPMEGIGLLREVEKIDSNNVQLQLAFASFSMKSGQTDKAIKRFNKVLQIDSTYLEAYLYLADIYDQNQDKANTLAMLEKYASKTTDVTGKLEVQKYIEELKSK